jgi:hypothetical protein
MIMKKALFSVILLSLLTACASQTAMVKPLPSGLVGKCMPASYAVSYNGTNPSDNLKTSVNRSFQEYLDDPGWWGDKPAPVDLAVTVNYIKTANPSATLAIGPLAPPAEMSGDVDVLQSGNVIARYRINTSMRSISGAVVFSDLEKRLASHFARQVMDALK